MTKVPIDILTPIIPRSEWHPNFERIVDHAAGVERDVLQAWATGFLDRDGKFVKEFQSTFNSSFWELYLYALWRSLGLRIDMTNPRPDFVLDGELGSFVAEATVAQHSPEGLPEWTTNLEAGPPERARVLDLACLRLSHAVMGKHKKWTNAYSRLQHCIGKPYIICVAPFEQPWAWLQGTEAIDRVLFGGTRPILLDDGGSPIAVGVARTESVYKPSGARIRLGLFCNDLLKEVSGVVFSSLATWSKLQAIARDDGRIIKFQGVRFNSDASELVPFFQPKDMYAEEIVDGAHLFVNPHATRKIDPGAWRRLGFAVHIWDGSHTLSDVPDGLLVQRNALTVRVREPGMPPFTPRKATSVQTPHIPSSPPDGVLFGGPGAVGATINAQLMLYCECTILVAMDSIDKDWACLIKRGVYLSVDEFVHAEPDSMTSYFETMELALAAAREMVDEGDF